MTHPMSDAKMPQRWDIVGEYDHHMSPSAEGDYVRVEDVEPLLAEIERLRAQLETLAGAIAQIERAAAGAIYSQEMIHAMARDALKSVEVKP